MADSDLQHRPASRQRKRKSPEELTLGRIKRKAEAARENLPELEADINDLLDACAPGCTLRLTPAGGIYLKTPKRKVRPLVIRPDASALRDGTVFQTPTASALSTAVSKQTIEARFVDAVETFIKNAHFRSAVNSAAKAAFASIWFMTPSDEIALLGDLARKLPPTYRPQLALTLSYALREGGEAGMKAVRQYHSSIPCLFRFITPDALLEHALNGDKLRDVVKAQDVDRAINRLAPNAVGLATPTTAHGIAVALKAAASVSELPKGRHQRDWLTSIMPAIENGGDDEFIEWLAKRSRQVNSISGDVQELTIWSLYPETDWNARLTLPKAFLRAADFLEKMNRKVSDAPLPAFIEPTVIGDVELRCPETAAEMSDWGQDMSNCLRSLNHFFTQRINAGSSAVLGLFRVKKNGSKQLTSTAELKIEGGKFVSVVQHSQSYNQKPTPTDRNALAALIEELADNNTDSEEQR